MNDFKLQSDRHTYEELENKYRHFIAPSFRIVVNNKDLAKEGLVISNLQVETSVMKEADTVSFSIANAYDLVVRDFKDMEKLLVLGAVMEIYMGYTDRLMPVFFGYITSVTSGFYLDEAPQLTVTGMDLSFKMMRGREAKIWSNKRVTDIVRELGQLYGATTFVIDESSKQIPVLPKAPGNDYHFLHNLAQSMNYEFFVAGKTIYFRERNKHRTPVLTLYWGKQLQSFFVEHNLAEQVTGVVVRGWDEVGQRVIKERAKTVDRLGSNTVTGVDVMKKLGSFEEHLYINTLDAEEARAKAEAALHERSMRLVSGEGVCIGLPELRAGKYIQLGGLAKRLNQPYYIVSALHVLDETGYSTRFKVQGNAV